MDNTPHLLSNETARTPLPLSRVDDIKHDPDPLITSLRNMAQRGNVFEWEAATFNEAADEIERTRKEVDLKGYRLDDALDEIERLRAEIKRLRSVVVLCPRCMEADRG